MKVTQEKLPASRVRLEIEIPAEQCQRAYDAKVKILAGTTQIPGFRKGKVPRQVLIQRLGSSQVKAMVLEELIGSTYRTAIEQEKIPVMGNPTFELSFEEMVARFVLGEPYILTTLVDVFPTTQIGDLTSLQVKAEDVEFQPQWLEDWLEQKRHQLATVVPVEGRGAILGDVLIVDYQGYQIDDSGQAGEKIAEIHGVNSKLDLDAKQLTVEGMAEGLVGIALEETRRINVSFPDDYAVESLQGVKAILEVTLKELKAKELPELDDDFAAEVGEEYESLEALKDSLTTKFQNQVQEQKQVNLDNAILAELLKICSVDLNEKLIEDEVTQQLQNTAAQMQQLGLTREQLQTIFSQDALPQLRATARPEAEQNLASRLIYLELAQTQNLEVDRQALEKRILELVQSFQKQGQEFDKENLALYVTEDMTIQTAKQWLRENVAVEWVPAGSLQAEETAVIESENS
jgi:trigger factor